MFFAVNNFLRPVLSPERPCHVGKLQHRARAHFGTLKKTEQRENHEKPRNFCAGLLFLFLISLISSNSKQRAELWISLLFSYFSMAWRFLNAVTEAGRLVYLNWVQLEKFLPVCG